MKLTSLTGFRNEGLQNETGRNIYGLSGGPHEVREAEDGGTGEVKGGRGNLGI